ncbi:hypothetical protein [Flavobacterium suzhouense]|uniref:Uncharacterized protein n=1 Tax=Flavobacterium suzhouense TaxID=1529638 RepID=A0ABW5NTZ3_9FLAO
MKQRYIVVPKDTSAEKALDYNEATDEQLIQVILDNEQFNSLYHSTFFEFINDVGNANIDDYEDLRINEMKDIENVHNVLSKNINKFGTENKSIVTEIMNLFKQAKERKTSVWFYF